MAAMETAARHIHALFRFFIFFSIISPTNSFNTFNGPWFTLESARNLAAARVSGRPLATAKL